MNAEIAPTPKTNELFDKRFVFAATAIGISYTAIVTVLASTIGKEGAGIAAVALTALATAIFRQFETLRFKQIADGDARIVSIPKLRIWHLVLAIFAFIGIQATLWQVELILWNYAGSLTQMFRQGGWLISLGLGVTSYLLGGFIIGKTAQQTTYTPVVIAALLRASLVLFIEYRWIPYPSFYFAYSAIYFFAALFGARLGFRRNP